MVLAIFGTGTNLSKQIPMKTFTQTGTYSILVLLPCLILCIALLFIGGFKETIMIVIFSFCILSFLICLLIFYKMTITIDDTDLSFIMGIGLIRKSFPLSDIESCTAVRNSPLWGIGIRMTPSGWLYNVSGLGAVELSFKNRKSRIRIGTDRPGEIEEAVCARITDVQAGSFYEKSGKRRILLTVAILTAFIGILVFVFVSGGRETELSFSDSSLTISGMYGMTISYNDILQTDTLQALPKIKTRTNGFASGGILKGHFKLHDNSKVMLFIQKEITPYIILKTSETNIYLNSGNPVKTRGYYMNIKERIIKAH
jgi:hypothetical protein